MTSATESRSEGDATILERLSFGVRVGLMLAAGWPSVNILPLSLTRRLLPRYSREELLTRIHLMVPWARASLRIFGGVLEVRGREHLPRPSRGYMFVANHQSYGDILVLISALETVAFLSKRGVRRIPLLGAAAAAGGTVFLNRRSREDRARALRETLRMCRDSTAVVVFPEGTVSEDGQLREQVYLHALEEAHRQGLVLIPVGHHGGIHLLPNSLDRVRPGTRIVVCIGAPLRPPPGASPREVALACWERVRELHGEAVTAAGPCKECPDDVFRSPGR